MRYHDGKRGKKAFAPLKNTSTKTLSSRQIVCKTNCVAIQFCDRKNDTAKRIKTNTSSISLIESVIFCLFGTSKGFTKTAAEKLEAALL